MFACGCALLFVAGGRICRRYRKCGKSCAQLHVDVCGRFLATLV
jgi:hypothetical protein